MKNIILLIILSSITLELSCQTNKKKRTTSKLETNLNSTNKFKAIDKFSNGLALSKHENLYGYLNEENQLVIKHQFYKAFRFKNGNAIVRDDKSNWGLIDTSGQFLFPLSCKWIVRTSKDLISVCEHDYTEILGKDLQPITNIKFEYPPIVSTAQDYKLKNGLIQVWKNSKAGFINKQGEYVIEPTYSGISGKWMNHYLAHIENKHGLLDKHFNVVIPFEYHLLTPLSSNPLSKYKLYQSAKKTSDGKYKFGVYNLGNEILPPKYDEIELLDEDRIRFRIGEEWKEMKIED